MSGKDGEQMTIILNDAGSDMGSVFVYSADNLELISADNCVATLEKVEHIAEIKISKKTNQTKIILRKC